MFRKNVEVVFLKQHRLLYCAQKVTENIYTCFNDFHCFMFGPVSLRRIDSLAEIFLWILFFDPTNNAHAKAKRASNSNHTQGWVISLIFMTSFTKCWIVGVTSFTLWSEWQFYYLHDYVSLLCVTHRNIWHFIFHTSQENCYQNLMTEIDV